jgi:hypothetical protein
LRVYCPTFESKVKYGAAEGERYFTAAFNNYLYAC